MYTQVECFYNSYGKNVPHTHLNDNGLCNKVNKAQNREESKQQTKTHTFSDLWGSNIPHSFKQTFVTVTGPIECLLSYYT